MKRTFVLAAITFFLILSGCANREDTAGLRNVQVGTWKTAQTIQPFLYGKYLAPNSEIKVLPFTNPGDQKTALLAGDLSMCGTTMVTAITAASKGEPVVVVSSLCNKCSALVVKKDSNIRTPADLRGKKIAYVPGTMHHVLLLETLKRAGLDPQKDVELKRIDFFDMGQALEQGFVDAFCSGEPYPSITVAKGYGRILSYPYFNKSIGTINAALLTTTDQIKRNRSSIQQLVTAQAKSTEYLKGHRSEWLNMAAEFGTDRTVLETALHNMELTWNMDEQYIRQARALAERMKDLGVIRDIPDMNKLFDLSFVGQSRKVLNR